ncbi:MAG: SDR family NAD(P)-dependent oxidoreductase, partial [Terriglobia bacterium]
MSATQGPARWALIVGSSSGFGEAVARELAREGLNIFGVHFDRRSSMDHVNEVIGALRAAGREVVFFNTNAADVTKRAEVLNQMQEH